MPYWRLFYHVMWAKKGREPLIAAGVEVVVVRSLRTTCRELRAIAHAIGVMPDHVHVAVSIPPSVAISTFVGRLKGASSHAVNALSATDEVAFGWQAEYGVLSFGAKALPDVVAYVNNQHAHHAARQVW